MAVISALWEPVRIKTSRLRIQKGSFMRDAAVVTGEEEELLPSVHPGDVLQFDFLEPMGMSAYRLAKGIGVPQTRIGQILKRERAVTADTAIRLGRFFNTTPEFWIGLQTQYDLETARRNQAKTYEQITAYAA